MLIKAFLRKTDLKILFNWLIISTVIYVNCAFKYWEDKERIIAWDAISYYAYLPATFIYNDISLKFADNAPEEVKSKIWYQKNTFDKRIIKTSSGISVLYSPFFFASHLYAKFSSYDANGYSAPYRFGLIASSIFYLALGLFFMRKTLSLYFPDIIVIFSCIIISVGTNLFYYVTTEPTMSHVYSFCLFSMFIYFTLKWYAMPSVKYTIIIGFLIGLISLVRPTNILIVLFFVLWNVKSFSDSKERFFYFSAKYKLIILISACAILTWLPQLLYWKTITGQWLHYSYGDTERFFFNDPKIISGLFSYRKGWLLYTPVMGFSLIGIFFLQQRLNAFFIPVLVFTVLNIYVIFSWWCWWYGGGFSMRSMIDSYALLSIPLSAFLFFTLKKGKIYFIFLSLVLSFLIFLNQFQTIQYKKGSIHFDSMSKYIYWKNFGKIEPIPEFWNLLDPIDYDNAKQGIR